MGSPEFFLSLQSFFIFLIYLIWLHFNVNLAMVYIMSQIHKVFKTLPLNTSFVIPLNVSSIVLLIYRFYRYEDFKLAISVSCSFTDIFWQSSRIKCQKNIQKCICSNALLSSSKAEVTLYRYHFKIMKIRKITSQICWWGSD